MSSKYSLTPEELIQLRNKINEVRCNGTDAAEKIKAIREIIRQWREQHKTREEDDEDEEDDDEAIKHDLCSDENLQNEKDRKLFQEICRKYDNSGYRHAFWSEGILSEEDVRRILLKTLEQLKEGLSELKSKKETNKRKEQDEKEEP